MELEQSFIPETFRKRILSVSEFIYIGLIFIVFTMAIAIKSTSDGSYIYDAVMIVSFLVIVLVRSLMRYRWSINALVKISATEEGLFVKYLEFDQAKQIEMDWDSFSLTDEGTETIPSNQVIVFRTTDGLKLNFYETTYQSFGQEAMGKLVVDINRIKTKYATPTTKWVL